MNKYIPIASLIILKKKQDMLTKLIHGAVFVFLLITFVMAQGGGYALDFDGNNEYSGHGTHSSLRPTTAITLEAWIYIHTNENWESAVSYAWDTNATESGYDLFCKGEGSYINGVSE